jgi:hypothetical protein
LHHETTFAVRHHTSFVAEGGLSNEVLRMIARHIRSVEKLEVLLLLRRSRQPWTGATVARELRIDPGSAANRLNELLAEGFVRADSEGCVYDARGELDRDVDALARTYAERRVAVITAIFSQPNETLRSFADAFRIKGKE